MYEFHIIIVMLFIGEMMGIDPASNPVRAFKDLIREVGYVESIQDHRNVQPLTVSAITSILTLINSYRPCQPQ